MFLSFQRSLFNILCVYNGLIAVILFTDIQFYQGDCEDTQDDGKCSYIFKKKVNLIPLLSWLGFDYKYAIFVEKTTSNIKTDIRI